jgi:PI31 proteasome regulator N-terminal
VANPDVSVANIVLVLRVYLAYPTLISNQYFIMPDILDPSALLASLPNLLPTPCTLKFPQDAIVTLIHSTMNALSFRVVGVDDSDSTTSYANNILPDHWNAHGPGHYTLRYRHEQSSLEFVVKVSKLAARTIVNAIAVEVCYILYIYLDASKQSLFFRAINLLP